ncbi:hypothetical protein Dda_6295 [Drechslerella dactyloides]|uniref:Uncharacterized protein n=1 Tax=Drechslerella dactyloides TaxID=74499 RepID=A0AAD6IVG0_DREDA|nr:hypothetical protein Dda_6295 [Drechslerella dactyloides]
MAGATIFSLADEILLQIVGWVQVQSHKLADSEYNRLLRRHLWDHKCEPKLLHALTQTCRRFRGIAYPIYYQKLAVGLGREKMPVSRLVSFVQLVNKYPDRGAAVRSLHLGPWLPKDFWTGQTPAKQDDGEQESKAEAVRELQRISIDLGLGDPKFLQAIDEGRPDMLLTLLLYSLPNLIELEFAVMSFNKPPHKVSSRWLVEALIHKQPPCAAMLQNIHYRVTGDCLDPWSGAVSEMMKFPNLEVFWGEPLGQKMTTYRDDESFTDYGEPESEEDSDGWESVGSDSEDEDEWEASSGEVEVVVIGGGGHITGAITTIRGGMPEIESPWDDDENYHDPYINSSLPKPGTCSVKTITLYTFDSGGLPLEEILAAPKALEHLTVMHGNFDHADDERLRRGILAQADSLVSFHTDFEHIKERGLLRKLKKLRTLNMGTEEFISGEEPEYPTSPNNWLPKSITKMTIDDLNILESDFKPKYEIINRMLETVDRDALPDLTRITMMVPSRLMRWPLLADTRKTLADRGVDFRYTPLLVLAEDDFEVSLKFADRETARLRELQSYI